MYGAARRLGANSRAGLPGSIEHRFELIGKLGVWLYALGAYALALIGAWGFAWLLKLDWNSTLLVIGAVAVIALFGTLIPVLRLGYARLNDGRK